MASINVGTAKDEESRRTGHGWSWAWIFQSRIAKVAAAAVVILAVVLAVNLFEKSGGSNVVWADVITQVKEAQDFICRVRQDRTEVELDMVEYRSAKYGLRVDMYRRDSGDFVAAQYLKPSQKMLYAIVHRDKTYALVELTEEQVDQMIKQTNAKEMVDFFRSADFEELGHREIDGKRVAGIEVDNPEPFRAIFDESTIRLWVDQKTNWPVQIESEGVAKGGDVRVKMVMDRFQWNPSLSAEDFEFEIPPGYTMIGQIGALEKDEAGAVKGLRDYARFSGGRYPSSLSVATAIHEIDDEIAERRSSGTMSKEDMGNFMRIQNACEFYVELREADKDAAYYGDKVGPTDFDKVLMRWKIGDDSYRVLYGDLRLETVNAGRLEELEGQD